MSVGSHHLKPHERAGSWALGFAEKCILPVLPNGELRQRLREFIDRNNARLHVRAHQIDRSD